MIYKKNLEILKSLEKAGKTRKLAQGSRKGAKNWPEDSARQGFMLAGACKRPPRTRTIEGKRLVARGKKASRPVGTARKQEGKLFQRPAERNLAKEGLGISETPPEARRISFHFLPFPSFHFLPFPFISFHLLSFPFTSFNFLPLLFICFSFAYKV